MRLEEDGRGATDNGAETEVGVHEGPGDEVEVIEGGRRVGERLSVGVDVLEGEEGVREMVEDVRDAGGTGFGDKTDMGAVVGERVQGLGIGVPVRFRTNPLEES